MDDLKIIFYIVVTILWFFYNNYRKVQKKARERDISDSPDPIEKEPETPFDWEKDFFPTESVEQKPEPVTKELITNKLPEQKRVLKPLISSERTRPTLHYDVKPGLSSIQRGDNLTLLNKEVSPIKLPKRRKNKNPLYDLKRTNWKKAVIISEVLNPPYL